MRNLDRIPTICDRLAKLWAKVPDWRLGQLLVNLINQDPFYMEDEEFLDYLESRLNEIIGE